MMPEGLEIHFELDRSRFENLLATDGNGRCKTLSEQWTDTWSDLMEFEIVPVRTSAEVAEIMRGH